MARTPDIHYAKNGDIHVAYQVIGDGPIDLVFTPEWATNLEAGWDEPSFARFLRCLASFTRLILFDQRGTGFSDPWSSLSELPTPERWIDDMVAVLDEVGARRPALLATGDGGIPSLLYAATHPERTQALVLGNAYATLRRDDDYPCGMPADLRTRVLEATVRDWGRGGSDISILGPSMAHDPTFGAWLACYERQRCSPGAARVMFGMLLELDLRHVLPAINVPTLVVQRAGNQHVRPGNGRYLADHIAGAKYVELLGADHWMWLGNTEEFLAEVEEFLTGHHRDPTPDRTLATVMFTDIVESTAQLAAVGDDRWRMMLDRHDAAVERQIDRYRGKLIKSTGDGLLATFDGPGRAIACALAVRDAVAVLGIDVRAGLHTGEVELRSGDIGGIAVHIAARVASMAQPGEVLVSRTVQDLVAGSDYTFDDRGSHVLRGVPGDWHLYAVIER